ncbi:unnamed protein product [Parnassius apollo]|uniref:(apollo) hypothetical protein n=1 Tax=Parnassius apollo TaxID=110799 RepID=A0A8S3Y2Y0_PARAO|nr:unnamed protein product [Parnassius apollo]
MYYSVSPKPSLRGNYVSQLIATAMYYPVSPKPTVRGNYFSQLTANGIHYLASPKPTLRGNYVSQLIANVIFYLENLKLLLNIIYTTMHHNIIRSLEDEHEHEQRLESGREYYNSLRLLISLSNERLRIENIQSLEMDEEREARLTADRFRHSLYDLDVHIEDQSTNSVAWSDKYKSGFAYNLTIDYRSSSVIDDMNVVCSFCNASKWSKESAGFCCSGDKINLPSFENPPELLKSLLLGKHVQSKQFLDNIRPYNSAFQMTSFGAQQISEGPFMPHQIYHLIGSLLPEDQPKFLQIYFVSDYNEQSNIRNQYFPNLNTELISQLQNMLHQEDLTAVGGKSLCEYGLPTPTSVGEVTNREYSAEIGYDSMEQLATLENGVPMMTAEQRSVYDRVCESVQNNLGTIWF